MLESTIDVSLSSYIDEIIANSQHKTTVSFATDDGIEMNINIEINQDNNIIIKNEFLYQHVKISYEMIDPIQVNILLDKYSEYIAKVFTKHRLITSWVISRDIKSVVRLITSIQGIKKILKRYEKLRSINVFTIDGYQNRIVARTTIELDADVITIIPPELVGIDQAHFCIRLHNSNIRLANHLFILPINRIFMIINSTKNILRVVSISFWIFFSIILFPPKLIFNDYLFLIFNFVGAPTMIFMSMPKILGYIIRKKLLV